MSANIVVETNEAMRAFFEKRKPDFSGF